MTRRATRRAARGFTLIEVVVALFIVAVSMGALLSTLTAAASNAGHLRDKSFAEWVALNRVAEVRLALSQPGAGKSDGTSEFAGQRWLWQQEVVDIGIPGVQRIDVLVFRDGEDPKTAAALATGYGFLGQAARPGDGLTPDYSSEGLSRGTAGTGAGSGTDGQTGTPATPGTTPPTIQPDPGTFEAGAPR
jgi:general secretion pathway protein I